MHLNMSEVYCLTLILFFISDFDSGVSLHSNWGLELVNRPRDTKGKVSLKPSVLHSIAWCCSGVLKTERLNTFSHETGRWFLVKLSSCLEL